MASDHRFARVRSTIRIPVFLVAAGLRRLFVSGGFPDWFTAATEFRRLTPPNRAMSTSRGLITYHPWYQVFDAECVHTCLSEAAALGTTFLRSDVRWNDLIPDGKHVNQDALRWYLGYFEAVRAGYGMEPMIVLSNPPRKLRGCTPTELRLAWEIYVQQVVDCFGHVCQSYQVLNELNNPLYRIFRSTEIPTALLSTAAIIRGKIPQAKVIVNVIAGVLPWRRYTQSLLHSCAAAIDVLGLDYYPGTWTFAGSTDWSDIEDFIRIVNDSTCEPAILETGYASNIPFFRTPQQQANYFLAWKTIVPRLEAICRSRKLAYVGIYELCDADSSAWLDPEAHFGLLDSRTLAPKPAFREIQHLFSLL
jgi:hypothetical protein